MPSRNKTYECICRLCTEGSSSGPDGKLTGKILLLSQKSAHMACLAAADEALRQAAVVDAATEAFKSLSLIDSDGDIPTPSTGGMSDTSTTPVHVCPPKNECSKLTRMAHSILDIVEQCVKACLARVDQMPTLDTLNFAEDELVRLQVLFDNVKRPVASIISWKAAIDKELGKLHTWVDELCHLRPVVVEPLVYDSSKSSFFINV